MAIIHFNTAACEHVAYYSVKKGNRITLQDGRQKAAQPNSRLAIAARSGRLIRLAFMPFLSNINDAKCALRLRMELFRSLESGQVRVKELEGFDFNGRMSLASLFTTTPHAIIDRTTRSVQLTLPPMHMPASLPVPQDVTHYRSLLACAAVNFKLGLYQAAVVPGQYIPVGADATQELRLTMETGLDEPGTVWLVAAGITCCRMHQGTYIPVDDNKHNAFAIIATA